MVVEDDKTLNKGLCFNLESDGYKVFPAHNAAEALERVKSELFDLAVLDVNLPDMDGFRLFREIKAVQDVPVVFLTARDLESDVINGFELGADDYITKPFNINIFRKKVSALIRRCGGGPGDVYANGPLTIDFNRLSVTVGGKTAALTPLESRLLKIFTCNANIILTRRLLLEKLWDNSGNFVDEHTLTVSINRLRRKLENSKQYIKTVYGVGYMWVDDNEAKTKG